MIRSLEYLSFIPFIDRLVKRKYYAAGLGTYIINSFFKRVLRVSRGDFLCHFTSRVTSGENIILSGDDLKTVHLSFSTSGGCYYQGLNGIEIEGGTIWSYNCCFVSANHSFKDLDEHEKVDPIKVGKFVWLGANCVVLPSVKIGSYSIIGAGSIVSKDIPPYSIAVGNPAKVVAKRCPICLDKIAVDELCENC